MQEAGRGIFDSDKPQDESVSAARAAESDEKKNWWTSTAASPYVYGATGFVVIAVILSWLQFSTRAICCGDYDGYYHIRWSQLLWESLSSGRWLPEFKWLPLTVLAPESYADHHFLFHLLQIPFLWFFEPVTAAKVAAVVFATLAVFSCYWLILRYKIEYPLVWLLGLLTCANPFYYRMNMAKAPPLSIVFTVLGAFLLFERRYIWLLPLTFFFVWTYSLFPMLIVAAVIWLVIVAWNEGTLEWQPVAYTIGGAVAGNVINPYFPTNLYLFTEHFLTKFKAGDYSVAVGGEWYPYDSWMLLGACAISFVAMFVGFILFKPSEKHLDEKATFFLVFATFLMVWTFKSKRFAEYFPPFAILFAAFSWQAFMHGLRATGATQLPEEFRRDLAPFLDKPSETESDERREFWKTAFVGLICVILLAMMVLNFRGVKLPERKIEYGGLIGDISGNDPPERYEKAMNWALQNIPEGERIFNTDWDDFPKMFYHNQKHVYISGLDPNYLFSRNPELSKLFEEITTGKTDDPAPLIKEKFGATWVFSDNHHDDFYAKAMESGWFDKVYEDDDSFILKMRDTKGDPPGEADEPPADAPTDEPAEPSLDETEETTEDAPNQ